MADSPRRGVPTALALGVVLALVGAAAPLGAADRNPLAGIDVETRGAGRLVRIRTETVPTFTVFRLSDPMRVVVDISGGDGSKIQAPITVEDGLLDQIAVRQFSADGFRIARVIVGLEKEVPYEVFAEGNAVVVATGEAAGAAVSRMAPPPVAPVDRAAAERLETVRAEAEEAAKRAAGERKAAEDAAANAKRQQDEAQRVAAEADRRASEAASAKAEAERVRAQAQAAAEKDRAQAQTALAQAEERLRKAEEASRRVAGERAEAERLAAQARRAQSEAEQAAAEAEAKAKRQKAELEERIAKAQSEERAAEQARARAAKAKTEAEAAQRAADDARVAAERVRAETTRRLDDIASREARVQADERALAADRQKLEGERQALAQRQRQLETERARQLERQKQLETESARQLDRQKELEAQSARDAAALAAAERERKKAEDALRAAAERERGLAAREQQARAQAERDAASREKETAERERKAREQALAEAASRETQLAAREKKAREAASEAQAEARAAKARVEEQSRLLARAERERKDVEARAERKQADGGTRGPAAASHPDVVLASAAVLPGSSATAALETPVPRDGGVATDASPAAPRSLRCSGVKTSAAGGGRILIATDGTPRFEMQRVDSPPRLVIDLAGTTRGTRRTTFDLKLAWAQRVRLGDHGETLRAVIDLARPDLDPTVTAGPDGLTVAMRTPTAAPPTERKAGAGGPAEPSADPTGDGGPAPTAVASSGKAETPVGTVKDVRFERRGAVARVVVDLAGTPTALVDDRSSKTWVLQLRDTRVPKELERSLDAGAYETVVKMVSTYQASQSPLVTNVVVTLGGAASQRLSQEGQALVWEIEAEAPRAPIAASSTPQTAAFTTEATVVAQSIPRETREKRVNMRLKDADLVNVIRFIADVTGENIIVSEDVKGKVTVNLRNVPWEQALDTILKSRGYDKVRANNIIRIATADEIQKEREREVAKRKALVESGETVIKMISVSYAVAKELVDQLKPMLSPRGTVQVDERTNTLVVEDLRDNINRVVELSRRLDRQTPQVLIEARIVEASSSFAQEIGIQWGGVGQASAQYGNQTGLVFPSDVIGQGAADDTQTVTSGTINPGRFAVNLPAAIGAGAGGGIGFIFGSASGGQLLSLRLSALETNGTGRIISSPRIATLDNRTAKIAQGVDIPISTVSAAGTNTRFIPANLELEVTPHVTNDGTVLLRLKTSKNEPDFANRGANGDPTIVKKSAETEVMVRDGDTAVIGGIYTRNTSENYSEVPFFSKIPVLGWLFKKRRNSDNRAELLVFITPRIINRESALATEAGSTLTPGGAPPPAGPGPAQPPPGGGQPGAPPPEGAPSGGPH